MHLVAVLLLTGGVRLAWAHRPGGAAALPGAARVPGASADSSARVAEAEARRARPLAPGETLDPNRASEEELDRLPGVGPRTARDLVRARDTLPFSSLEDLTRARGIGARTVERLRPHLALGPVPVSPGGRGGAPAGGRPAGPPRAGAAGTSGAALGVGPVAGAEPTPIWVNRASAQDLTALPGVGPVLAGRIVAQREQAGHFRTPEDLLPVKGVGPALLERIRPHLRF
ncbi:MAG: helix-hairpin-helix domain-containing protein [Longimicrobiales bacterium]|nr:helix-hairpin-helix domain-containing protein [Longimicrobiales bacterium]